MLEGSGEAGGEPVASAGPASVHPGSTAAAAAGAGPEVSGAGGSVAGSVGGSACGSVGGDRDGAAGGATSRGPSVSRLTPQGSIPDGFRRKGRVQSRAGSQPPAPPIQFTTIASGPKGRLASRCRCSLASS